MEKTPKFRVVVKSYNDENFCDVIGTNKTERQADRIEDGININLNHDEYYVVIEEEK